MTGPPSSSLIATAAAARTGLASASPSPAPTTSSVRFMPSLRAAAEGLTLGQGRSGHGSSASSGSLCLVPDGRHAVPDVPAERLPRAPRYERLVARKGG